MYPLLRFAIIGTLLSSAWMTTATAQIRTPQNAEAFIDHLQDGDDPLSPEMFETGFQPIDLGQEELYLANAHRKSFKDVLPLHTSVKSQGQQATCSIFSTTAHLEHMMVRSGLTNATVDLSEAWLIYLTAGQQGRTGVTVSNVAKAMGQHGIIPEKQWPFTAVPWSEGGDKVWFSAANRRCSHTRNTEFYNMCLIGQRDPRLLNLSDEELLSKNSPFSDVEFQKMRALAKTTLDTLTIQSSRLKSKKDILAVLDRGEAISLSVRFFYEAWSHRKAPDFGLERNMDFYNKGIVSYPHKNSKDVDSVRDSRTGHAVVIVAYDPNIVIERTVLDKNNQPMKIKTTGVYYFKNSWGPDGFGHKFQVDGTPARGYGMISMDYAHEWGVFDRLKVTGK